MRVLLCAAACGLACSSDAGVAASGLSGGPEVVPPPTTSTGGTSIASTTAADATTGSTTTAAASTDALRVDMGSPDLPQGSACNGKIDILFAIGQGGVAEHLDVLQGSYAAFATTMVETFDEHDIHVMVVDGDGEWGDGYWCPKDKCPADGGCPAVPYGDPNDYPCWALYDDAALSKCDSTLGAGVVFPAGFAASNKPCNLPGGHRYLSGDDPDFGERFVCVASVGAAGGKSMVGWAMGEALSIDLQEGCNEGFLREDALLLVVMIVGFEESPYNPYVWAQRVLEAKGDEQDKIVALAVGTDHGAVEDPLCDGNGDEAGASFQWLQNFDHRVFGSKCAPDFAPFFFEAAELAAELCQPGTPN